MLSKSAPSPVQHQSSTSATLLLCFTSAAQDPRAPSSTTSCALSPPTSSLLKRSFIAAPDGGRGNPSVLSTGLCNELVDVHPDAGECGGPPGAPKLSYRYPPCELYPPTTRSKLASEPEACPYDDLPPPKLDPDVAEVPCARGAAKTARKDRRTRVAREGGSMSAPPSARPNCSELRLCWGLTPAARRLAEEDPGPLLPTTCDMGGAGSVEGTSEAARRRRR